MVIAICAVIIFLVNKKQNTDPPGQGGGTTVSQSAAAQQQAKHEDIYVPALERSVSWSSEYDCYYDKMTDCYFLLNTDVEPEVWQYWFETVSSAYGDYGWMEWDAKEQKWYVETGENRWELLPEKDQGSNYLWHFD